MTMTMLKPIQGVTAEAPERKLKFKGKRPATLNLEEAKKEIGIGDGAEHRLTPASPSWARKSFADADEDSKRTTGVGRSLGANALPDARSRPHIPMSPRLSVVTTPVASIARGRVPFDFEKRLREDYRRCYV